MLTDSSVGSRRGRPGGRRGGGGTDAQSATFRHFGTQTRRRVRALPTLSPVSWLLWWRQPPRLIDVLVNLKHDPDSALRGVLWSARGGWVVLRSAKLIT